MRSHRRLRCFLAAALMLTAAGAAQAAALRSTARNQRNAVMEHAGFFLAPVGTEPEGEGDLAPPQLFELIRPNDQPITIGRLYTSCVCVTLEADKTTYAQGEKAVLRLRNVRPSPPNGQLYAVYAQVTRPIRTVLRADTFLQSTMFLPSKPGEAPTRGDIVADGVLTDPIPEAGAADSPAGSPAAETLVGEDGIEIIVPKADNYVPDTSEYGLRKQAEAEAAAEAAAKPEDGAEAAAPEEEDDGPIISEVADIEETGE